MDKTLVKRLLQPLWRIAATGKVKLNVPEEYGRCEEVHFFGKSLLRTRDLRACLALQNQKTNKHDVPVLYFKINRIDRYTCKCIQAWVDVAESMNAKYYFVCDNPFLKHIVLQRCRFANPNIDFIESMRKDLKGIVDYFCDTPWKNATFAHLTPFYHAKQHGIRQFWCIDADDTMFLLAPTKVTELLTAAAAKADNSRLSISSLDMHYSRSGGKHWSLGVVYVSGITDFCDIFEQVTDKEWTNRIDLNGTLANLDWFFTYLKRSNENIEIGQFYIENCYFIHWGNFLIDPISSSVYSWGAECVTYRVMASIFGLMEPGVVPIADGDKIDLGLSGEEGPRYWLEAITTTNNLGDNARELWQVRYKWSSALAGNPDQLWQDAKYRVKRGG